MRIPMLKIRRSRDCLIFNMGILILVRWYLIYIYWDNPRSHHDCQLCHHHWLDSLDWICLTMTHVLQDILAVLITIGGMDGCLNDQYQQSWHHDYYCFPVVWMVVIMTSTNKVGIMITIVFWWWVPLFHDLTMNNGWAVILLIWW